MRSGTPADVVKAQAALNAEGIQVVDLNRQIARDAAELRAARGLDLADAAIVATALAMGCDAIVGNDRRCAERVRDVPYFLLDDLVKEPL
jgi:predicted nucleic acid-binding protein